MINKEVNASNAFTITQYNSMCLKKGKFKSDF